MANGLQNFPNIIPADYDFLAGRIKDNPGDGSGTPINQFTNGDIQEFFAKLMNLAGIAPNGLPDSEYTGHQYIQALVATVFKYNTWQHSNVTTGSSIGAGTGSSSLVQVYRKWIKNGNVCTFNFYANFTTASITSKDFLVLIKLPVNSISDSNLNNAGCAQLVLNDTGGNQDPFAANMYIDPINQTVDIQFDSHSLSASIGSLYNGAGTIQGQIIYECLP